MARLDVGDQGLQCLRGDLRFGVACRLAAQQLQRRQRGEGGRFGQPGERVGGQGDLSVGQLRDLVEPSFQLRERFLSGFGQYELACPFEDAGDERAPEDLLAAVEPGVEPGGVHGDLVFGGLPQLLFHHFHQAGLPLTPSAEDADGERRGRLWIGDDLRQRLGVGIEVELIFLRRLVGEGA